jgi:hypothetical protein
VTGVSHVKNPVRLARRVMEDSPHVFLSGAGAEEFARDKGIEMVDPDWFATPERWRQLQELKAKNLGWFDVDLKYGTVGAVAVDRPGTCRGDLDRRADRQALGADRGFAGDRRGHLCRRPRLRSLGHRHRRILHPRRSGARDLRADAAARRDRAGRGRCGDRRCRRARLATAG